MNLPLFAGGQVIRLIICCFTIAMGPVALAADAPYQVGLAEVDITPAYPIRLNGFGNRRTESEGVTHNIRAKALTISDGKNSPALLITVDSLGIPDYMTREVASRLAKKKNLDPTRLSITATHTHTAPMLKDCCPTIFGQPIPPEHQQHIDQYTRELTDHLEQVATKALDDLHPGSIEFAQGKVAFAMNRRTKGGPVDHDLPVLFIRDKDKNLKAIYTSYACHCVTLSNNKISGDWAGYAAEQIEKAHPGILALTSIGCGADANPTSGVTGDKVNLALEQGKQIADEVERLLKQPAEALKEPIATQLNRITLPFNTHPTREQWENVARQQDAAGYHARVNLARLDRGEKLQAELSYPIQTWTFGNQLAMVFLPGEVVVDYSTRLKRELDRSRLWINAYANDVPCYIPSERILKEGGYEGIGAMIYYDRPTKLATGIEQKIIDEVHRQIPDEFNAPKGTEGVPPRSPQASLRSIHTKPGLEVQLVASEPLVQSPVAIDWRADGKMLVCEMYDYPTGADGNWRPGGRIKLLADTNNDGVFDDAKVFLENIPFPTGVTAWGNGAIVCAAPDILYAQDTDNDGKADKIEKLFTGFATDNYQARVNSISLGLDNWLYAGNGLLGGTITNDAGVNVDIRNHDFRFRPLKGPIELVTGLTQYGRVRDDFGAWFGCDNSNALFHYPHEERYLRRNPHAPAPPPVVRPPANYDASRIYPISRTLDRFNEPGSANHITSACGLAIYRDSLLGPDFTNNAFVAEPVHNLVHRMILKPDENGVLSRQRAADEKESEFLASTDNWSRPVQVRTGPDGALYVVDMYRFLIEHPRWIPAERLASLDIRAGADKGRIYRIKQSDRALRPVRDLSKLSSPDLAATLDTPSGTDRDRIHTAILLRQDRSAVEALQKLATDSFQPQVRVQALCALEGLNQLHPSLLSSALKDSDPRVRAHAISLCEGHDFLLDSLLPLAGDPSPIVRQQVAYTLGEFAAVRAGEALANLAAAHPKDEQLRIAVLSSATPHCAQVLSKIATLPDNDAWLAPLVATAAASDNPELLRLALDAVFPADSSALTAAQLDSLTSLLEALHRKNARPPERLSAVIEKTRSLAADNSTPLPLREASIRLLAQSDVSADLLCSLIITPTTPDSLRSTALAGLRRQQSPDIAERLITAWPQTPPSSRPEIISLLLSREQWTSSLLDAISKRQIQATEISLESRQQLAQNPSDKIRARAAEIFSTNQSTSRAEVLQRYKDVPTLTGSPAAGSELFAKNCSACHALNGIGHEVGPNLSALRGRDIDYLVKNILDPNAVIEPRFVNYQIQLKDKRLLSGIIKSETTSTLTLLTGGSAGGATSLALPTETINRSDIKQIRATTISMMPEGFESALNPQQLADLISFIRSTGSRRQFAGNTPATITPTSDGSLYLPAAKAEIFGEQLVFEPEFQNLGYWHSAGDYAAWTLRTTKSADYDVHFDFACAADSAGNTFTLEISGQHHSAIVQQTGPDWSRYKQIKIARIHLNPGEHRLILRPDRISRGALIDLRTIALTPTGSQPRWPASAPPAPPADELARDPAAVARVILDPTKSSAAREAAINANPQFAADLISELTRDLQPSAEYDRIPWIWRIAIAAGKRNDTNQLKRILDVSLPALDQSLRHWQAVVLGGGIINGISQQNLYPAARLSEILNNNNNDNLTKRYHRAIDLASTMADNDEVPPGTRYDALRMLGAQTWDKRGKQLTRYLAKNIHPELQMGAASAVSDIDSPHATDALLSALPDLKESNRNLAIDAFLRDPSRAAALLDAVQQKRIDASLIDPARMTRLRELASRK